MSEYRITKEQCEKGISGVCSRCGGPLSALETVDNARNPTHWAGCEACSCFDNGVPKHAYDIAKVLVCDDHETYYSYICNESADTPEDIEYKNKRQIGGMSRLVQRILYLHTKRG